MYDSPAADTPVAQLQKLLTEKWPEATRTRSSDQQAVFRSGVTAFNALFPAGGVPFGQWIEITGAAGSGRTGLLFAMLAGSVPREVVAYVDFAGSFFPAAALAAGVDLQQVRVLQPRALGTGLRTVETVLSRRQAPLVVLDCIGLQTRLPDVLAHRLRQQTVQAGALLFFLTEPPGQVIGPSMVALRLAVTRQKDSSCVVCVDKSRLCNEGTSFIWSPGTPHD
jgi:hypothetical protein